MNSSFKPEENSKNEPLDFSENMLHTEESEPIGRLGSGNVYNGETPGLKELIETLSGSERNLQVPGVSVADSLLEDLMMEFVGEMRLNPRFFSKTVKFERDRDLACAEGNKTMISRFMEELREVLQRRGLKDFFGKFGGSAQFSQKGILPPQILNYRKVHPLIISLFNYCGFKEKNLQEMGKALSGVPRANLHLLCSALDEALLADRLLGNRLKGPSVQLPVSGGQEASIMGILDRAEQCLLDWNQYQCGLLLRFDDVFQGNLRKEEKMSKMLCDGVLEAERGWVTYDNEHEEIGKELGELIFEDLVGEIVEILRKKL